MKDQFVTYEIERELISLGFDRNNRITIGKLKPRSGILWQQAFDWFHREYQLFGYIFPSPSTVRWNCQILDVTDSGSRKDALIPYPNNLNNSYEEARLVCLIKLIELTELKEV